MGCFFMVGINKSSVSKVTWAAAFALFSHTTQSLEVRTDIESIILDGRGPNMQKISRISSCKSNGLLLQIEQEVGRASKNHDAKAIPARFKVTINGRKSSKALAAYFDQSVWTGEMRVHCGDETIVKLGFGVPNAIGQPELKCKQTNYRLLEFRIVKGEIKNPFLACHDLPLAQH
jgi:hypothetical protein